MFLPGQVSNNTLDNNQALICGSLHLPGSYLNANQNVVNIAMLCAKWTLFVNGSEQVGFRALSMFSRTIKLTASN
jgi:hypothetical protein